MSSSCLKTFNAQISLFPLPVINRKFLSMNLRNVYSDINSSFSWSPHSAVKWLWPASHTSPPCPIWAEALYSAGNLITPFSTQKLLILRSPLWKQSSAHPGFQVQWFIPSLPVWQGSVRVHPCIPSTQRASDTKWLIHAGKDDLYRWQRSTKLQIAWRQVDGSLAHHYVPHSRIGHVIN